MGLFAFAVIRRGEHVLLVRQGAAEPEVVWSLPGGRVRDRELPPEAVVREVRDVAGIEIEVKDLVYIAQLQDWTEAPLILAETEAGESRASQGLASGTFTTVLGFKADFLEGDSVASDLDELSGRASFVPLEEALTLLIQKPVRFLVEPITSYLIGEVDRGSGWFYRRDDTGAERLIARFPAGQPFRGKLPTTARVRPLIRAEKYERRQQIVVLGCIILFLALVVLIVVGIIALTHKA